MKISRIIITAIVACFALASCETKPVDIEYPAQKVYIPAAKVSPVYWVDAVELPTYETPTPGAPYKCVLDYDEGYLRVPVSVYRSGINNAGAVKVDVYIDEEVVDDAVLEGLIDLDADGIEYLDTDLIECVEKVTIKDGEESAGFDVMIDIDFLEGKAPDHKYAFGLSIECRDREVTEGLDKVVFIVDTKIFEE